MSQFSPKPCSRKSLAVWEGGSLKGGLVGRSVPHSGGGKVAPFVLLAGILQALIDAIPGAFWPDSVR